MAEQAVLGGLMIDPSRWHQVRALLSASDFWTHRHRVIFEAMEDAIRLERPIDAVTLGDSMERAGTLRDIDGAGYLIDLASSTPSAANVEAYARIVREKTMLRELIAAGQEIVTLGFEPGARTGDEALGYAAGLLSDINTAAPGREVTAKAGLGEMFRAVQAVLERGDELAGLTWGFAGLDALTGGMADGRVYGVGARPKIGKTTLALGALHANLVRGKACALWSMEMPAKEVMQRLACAHGSVSAQRMKQPKLMEDGDWARLTAAIQDLSGSRLTVFDQPRMTIEQVEAQAMRLHAMGRLDLAVIDYLGLFEMPKADRHDLAIGKITGRLKGLAMRLGIPILLVFQLNRGSEKDSVKVRPPRPSDARDSGAIEQDLDCMVLLHRPSLYSQEDDPGLRCEVAIQRDGPTGVIRLEEELEFCRFAESDRGWTDQQASKAKRKADGWDTGL